MAVSFGFGAEWPDHLRMTAVAAFPDVDIPAGQFQRAGNSPRGENRYRREGEDEQAVRQVMDDMRSADVDFLTIGQYLQPTPKHHKVDRFVTPEEFKSYEKAAYGKGFLMVSASPLTRSSHHAGDDFARLRAAREAKLARKGA